MIPVVLPAFPDHRSTCARVWDAILTHMVIVPLTELSEYLLAYSASKREP